MHYRGMVRVVQREKGIRIYAVQEHGPAPADAAARRAQIDALVDAAVQIYAPLPDKCLADLVRRLRFAVPQFQGELKDALRRAKQRLANAHVDHVDWSWPAQENAVHYTVPDTVHLLTPFDPVVWDRDRFEMFWGWRSPVHAIDMRICEPLFCPPKCILQLALELRNRKADDGLSLPDTYPAMASI